MAGLQEFVVQFGTEKACIEHLAALRWPGGFACSGCGGREPWRLKARPRVYECAACHRQERRPPSAAMPGVRHTRHRQIHRASGSRGKCSIHCFSVPTWDNKLSQPSRRSPLRSAGRHRLARTPPRRVRRWLAASTIAPPAPALYSAGDDSHPHHAILTQNRGAVPEGPRGETRPHSRRVRASASARVGRSERSGFPSPQNFRPQIMSRWLRRCS